MKTKLLSPFLGLIAGALFATAIPASAADDGSSHDSPQLQVQVETPTVFDIIRERDISDALAVQLRAAFRRGGFDGDIEQIYDRDDAQGDVPLLALRLTDWEKRPTGFVECRLTARLIAPDGTETNLGAFSGTAHSWNRLNRFELSRSFEDAALNAMRDLYHDYRKVDTDNGVAVLR